MDEIDQKKISVVAPIFNESGNIGTLLERLLSVLEPIDFEFEIIAVDDCSTDDSFDLLRDAASDIAQLKVLRLSKNHGQTSALMAGFEHATGDYIISIDADLQNDPKDIPNLINKLEEGFDVVSGWRVDRKDAPFTRNFPSRIANRLIARASGVELHDFGCSLKAYRADIVAGLKLYGEMHRFIPIYATWLGASVAEIPVAHHARVHGKSNYGLERVFKVIFDLMVVTFLNRYFSKPMYLFGSFGMFAILVSMITFAWMVILKVFQGVSMIQTPLPVLSAVTFMLGILSVLIGLVAEMLLRTYYESQKLSPYLVSHRINFTQASE